MSDELQQDAPVSAGAYPPGWVPSGPPPPKPRGKGKWIGAAVVVVVVAVGAVALLAGRDSGTTAPAGAQYSPQQTVLPAPKTSAAPPTAFASAGDKGPVAIITSDDTCGPWDNVQTAVTAAQKKGWAQRDPSVPSAQWAPSIRREFEAVGEALRSGADTAVTLASQTPHRALRELYDAFIVYGRAYADALPRYQPGDDSLARTSLAALDAITTICAANRSITAMPQVPAVGPVRPPTTPPAAVDSANTQRFLPPGNPTCARWASDAAALQEQAADWLALDPNIGVAQWTPSQRAVSDNAARVFTSHADDMEASGRASGNAVVEDFATLGALYFRAFVVEQPLYWTGDHDLADVGFTLNDVVASACQVS